MKNIKGIIFDYGGTIDTGGDHWSWIIYDAWQQAGVAADLPLFREAYVYAERELARTLHILPHHNFADLLRIKMNIELQWLAQNGHFPPAQVEEKATEIAEICHKSARAAADKAKPVLDNLYKKYPMALVSNFYGNVNTVLEEFDLKKYFKDVIESAVVGVRKPDPKIFTLGVEALGCKPEEALVVGDNYSKDIAPALKAGCQAIWLKGKGWTEEEDKTLYPQTITSLDQLLAFFDKA